MAKKFFYNKVYNPKKKIISISIIIVAIIGIIICFLFTKNLNKKCTTQAIEIHDSISMEVNDSLPEKSMYFKELQCVDQDTIKINTNSVDYSKVGTYEVIITVNEKDYIVKLDVIDSTSPIIKVKDVNINSGSLYTINDFIDYCSDNSNDECEINFYDAGTDVDGKIIDYSSFKDNGKYEIKIMAKDTSGNQTIETANLTIGTSADSKPSVEEPIANTCKYGNLEYDENTILAINVGSSGCAISLDLYHDKTVQKGIESIAETETKKIQSEINKISGLNSSLTVNRSIIAILNTSAIGIVGYSLKIEVSDIENNIIASYYLDLNGNRIFEANPFDLK